MGLGHSFRICGMRRVYGPKYSDFPFYSKLHNMDDTRVTVVVRCKPFTSRERISEGDEGVCCVQMLGTKTIVTTPGTQNSQMPLTRTFNFDQSLWSHDIEDANFVHQQEVFNRIGQGVVESGMSGYNTTIFAYGQTVSVPEYTNELFML